MNDSTTGRTLLAALTLLIAAAPSALTQENPRTERSFVLRIPSGALISTGDRGRALKDAQVTAVQMAWSVRPALALTGTFAWAHSRNLAAVGTPKLDILTADIGIERGLVTRCTDCRVGYSGFAGVGAGTRSYDQRGPGIGAATAFAGYVSAGGGIRIRRVGLRLEVRDYVGSATSLPGAASGSMRNDVVLMAGLRLVRRR